MLKFKNLTYQYQQQMFCYDGQVETGKLTAVFGPSGGGKSTLLLLVAGLLKPVGGDILFEGHSLVKMPVDKRPLTILFQAHNLFPHLTVFENIAIGLSPRLKITKGQQQEIDEVLVELELQDFKKRRPQALSGGQQQRVALARALARGRPLLLLDEPFSSLDPGLRLRLLHLVQKTSKRKGLTVLFVNHHPLEVASVANDAIFIQKGRIMAQGTPKALLKETENEAIRRYLGDLSEGL